MLTNDILETFALRDTADVVATLRDSQLLGTVVEDRLLGVLVNYPARRAALIDALGR
jgi:hypothetical protein